MLKRKKDRNFKPFCNLHNQKAQSAVEYMLLFATVMVVVMFSFESYFPFLRKSSDEYYNSVVIGIVGKEAPNFCHADHGGPCGVY